MRVGYLTACYPRATDTFIQREVAGLRAAGVQVETFSVRTPTAEHFVGPEQRDEHARTTYLLAAGAPAMVAAHLRLLLTSPKRWIATAELAWRARQPGLRGLLLQGAYFLEAGLLARLARRRGLDHLHNHFGDSSGSVTMLAAALGGLPFSMTIHGPHVFFERSRWRLDIKTAQAAFVVCISHFARSQVMAVTPVERWQDLHIVHCGVDPSAYDEPTDEAGRFRVLVVGRLDKEKGLPVLLDAAKIAHAQVPALRVDLIGDGPDRAALEDRVRKLGLDEVVRFLGSKSPAIVREELRVADLVVMSSFAEGLPVVLMEALAARTPVVSTNIMGVPELVRDRIAGRLVPPGDVDALAAAVVEMAELTPEARRALGEAGRSVVEEHFDVRQEAARLAALFELHRPSKQRA